MVYTDLLSPPGNLALILMTSSWVTGMSPVLDVVQTLTCSNIQCGYSTWYMMHIIEVDFMFYLFITELN